MRPLISANGTWEAGRDVDDAPFAPGLWFSTNPWFLSRVWAIELFPIRRALKERALLVVERSFPVQTLGEDADSNRSHDRFHSSGTATSPFYVRLFPNDVHDAHVPRPGSADKFKSVSDDPFVRNFFAVLEEMDKQIGRVVATIDELNLQENTLILFTSDNGPTDWPRKYKTGPPAGFTGPYRGRKWSLFEGGIRMPFIARWTGTIPPGINDTISVVSAIDVGSDDLSIRRSVCRERS